MTNVRLSVKKNRLDKEILTQQREVEKLKLELSGVDGKMEDLLKVCSFFPVVSCFEESLTCCDV